MPNATPLQDLSHLPPKFSNNSQTHEPQEQNNTNTDWLLPVYGELSGFRMKGIDETINDHVKENTSLYPLMSPPLTQDPITNGSNRLYGQIGDIYQFQEQIPYIPLPAAATSFKAASMTTQSTENTGTSDHWFHGGLLSCVEQSPNTVLVFIPTYSINQTQQICTNDLGGQPNYLQPSAIATKQLIGDDDSTYYKGLINPEDRAPLKLAPDCRSHAFTNPGRPSRPPIHLANRTADPKPPHAYLTLVGYRGHRNSAKKLDCFDDCVKQHLARKGFERRGNLLAHLRRYHGQDIPRGG